MHGKELAVDIKPYIDKHQVIEKIDRSIDDPFDLDDIDWDSNDVEFMQTRRLQEKTEIEKAFKSYSK